MRGERLEFRSSSSVVLIQAYKTKSCVKGSQKACPHCCIHSAHGPRFLFILQKYYFVYLAFLGLSGFKCAKSLKAHMWCYVISACLLKRTRLVLVSSLPARSCLCGIHLVSPNVLCALFSEKHGEPQQYSQVSINTTQKVTDLYDQLERLGV